MLLRLLLLSTAALAISAAAEPVNQLSEAEKLDGWQLLFDGKTTTGWEGFNDTPFPSQSWALEDGTIRTLADSAGGDLVTVSQFENFELVFDWKIVEHGNSGVKYGVQKAWAGPGPGRILALGAKPAHCSVPPDSNIKYWTTAL